MTGFDHVVLNVAADSVLWTKERRQLDLGVLVKQIGCMAETMVDRCLIADQSDACAANSPMFK
jgi:hypothetical protein